MWHWNGLLVISSLTIKPCQTRKIKPDKSFSEYQMEKYKMEKISDASRKMIKASANMRLVKNMYLGLS